MFSRQQEAKQSRCCFWIAVFSHVSDTAHSYWTLGFNPLFLCSVVFQILHRVLRICGPNNLMISCNTMLFTVRCAEHSEVVTLYINTWGREGCIIYPGFYSAPDEPMFQGFDHILSHTCYCSFSSVTRRFILYSIYNS